MRQIIRLPKKRYCANQITILTSGTTRNSTPRLHAVENMAIEGDADTRT